MEKSFFPDRVKTARAAADITQKELADKAGITAAMLSAYEGGTKSPNLSTAVKIALALDVSLDWLTGITPKLSGVGVTTYMDAATMLLSVLGAIPATAYQDGPDGPMEICFSDEIFRRFTTDIVKMNNLLQKNTIEADLFELWLDKQLASMDIPVKKHKCKSLGNMEAMPIDYLQ